MVTKMTPAEAQAHILPDGSPIEVPGQVNISAEQREQAVRMLMGGGIEGGHITLSVPEGHPLTDALKKVVVDAGSQYTIAHKTSTQVPYTVQQTDGSVNFRLLAALKDEGHIR